MIHCDNEIYEYKSFMAKYFCLSSSTATKYCEIPSNVILADEFCKLVDGFSRGSNDLTQLCLGIDRDAGNLAFIGNETNQAVKILISMAIKSCKNNGVKIVICGQGPSDIPEFAEFLVKEGIDTISLVPDSIIKTVFNLDRL